MSPWWLNAIRVELAIGVLAGLGFVAVHGAGPWRHTRAGRQLMAMAAIGTGELATLLLIAEGVAVPMWVLVAGYGLVDVVMIRWLLLRWRSRREENDHEHEDEAGGGRGGPDAGGRHPRR